MNWAHVHLIINHFPVIGMILTIFLLIFALLRKSEELKNASLGAFVFIALTTIPVYFTGQAAVEVVKNLPGVTEAFYGRHEEVASLALVVIEALGIVSLGGLIFFRRASALPKWFMALVLALSLLAAAITGLTANLGGQIRHTEIREGAALPQPASPTK